MVKRLLAFMAAFVLIFFIPGCTANAAELQASPDLEKIDGYVERMMKECRIPGFSLAIVKDGRVVYTQGYGIADPTGRKVNPETPFQIASISKTFTALAVMQLAEAGKLSLDEPIHSYMPQFGLADERASETITVRNLLCHTSGLGSSAEFGVASVAGDGDSVGQLVERMKILKPTAPVGSRFQYNNANYIILGRLIETVSGLTYDDYIKQNIFEPLGMRHSYFSPDEAKKDGMAAGYRTVFGFPSVSGLPYRTDFIPASGVITCAEDLSKYMLAMMNGGIYKNNRIISAEGLARMLEPNVKVSGWESYGLGWYVTSGSYYHGGELTDFQSKLKIMPEEALGIAFVYNTSSSTATTLFKTGYRDRIESGIVNILYGLDPDDVPRGGFLDLNRYPMTVTYDLYLVLCILAVLLIIFSFIRLRSFMRRLISAKKRLLPVILFAVMVNLVLPVILLGVPGFMHLNWLQLLFNVPDVSWLVLSIIVCLLICGIVKVFIISNIMRQSMHRQANGERMHNP
ncbi:MAG TPA: serine hydrolase domain-containing protein [Clostridia bacterium]|nr:serine hydrolase domain-containing protein [Clostridia bacterium]